MGFSSGPRCPASTSTRAEADRRLVGEWTELVERDRDHPSVVAWVVANESFGLGDVDPATRSDLVGAALRPHAPARRHSPGRLERRLGALAQRPVHDPRLLAAARTWRAATARSRLPSTAVPMNTARTTRATRYRDEPLLVTEFGGLRVAGSGGWGWLEVKDGDEFVRSYGALIDAFMEPGPVQGFCYTQLTDVEQEQNGLLTAGREPKVAPELIAPLTRMAKRA